MVALKGNQEKTRVPKNATNYVQGNRKKKAHLFFQSMWGSVKHSTLWYVWEGHGNQMIRRWPGYTHEAQIPVSVGDDILTAAHMSLSLSG